MFCPCGAALCYVWFHFNSLLVVENGPIEKENGFYLLVDVRMNIFVLHLVSHRF